MNAPGVWFVCKCGKKQVLEVVRPGCVYCGAEMGELAPMEPPTSLLERQQIRLDQEVKTGRQFHRVRRVRKVVGNLYPEARGRGPEHVGEALMQGTIVELRATWDDRLVVSARPATPGAGTGVPRVELSFGSTEWAHPAQIRARVLAGADAAMRGVHTAVTAYARAYQSLNKPIE